MRDAVGRSLDGASDWLKTAKCQSLLSEFADQDGRLLKERLGALALTLDAYLRILVFERTVKGIPHDVNGQGSWPLQPPTAVSSVCEAEHSPGPHSAIHLRAGPRSFTKCFTPWASAKIRPSRRTSPIASENSVGRRCR